MRLAARLLVLATLATASPADEPARPRVVVLVSSGAGAYAEAAAAVRRALETRTPRARLETMSADQAGSGALGSGVALVVAVGAQAARQALLHAPGRPMVYAMVLEPAELGLPRPGETPSIAVTGVTMQVSPEEQFLALKEIAPRVVRVGVLYDPAASAEQVRRAQQAARTHGLHLVPQPVRSEGDVLGAARLLAPQVDALWAIADPTVLTPSNARALILLALRARKPFFAMTEGYVRSGALAALAADPQEVGRRAGELASRLLAGTPAHDLRPERPPRLALFINRASATHLGLALGQDLMARAQKVYPQP
jgi:putative ABC transport system substrate-binding protein